MIVGIILCNMESKNIAIKSLYSFMLKSVGSSNTLGGLYTSA